MKDNYETYFQQINWYLGNIKADEEVNKKVQL